MCPLLVFFVSHLMNRGYSDLIIDEWLFTEEGIFLNNRLCGKWSDFVGYRMPLYFDAPPDVKTFTLIKKIKDIFGRTREEDIYLQASRSQIEGIRELMEERGIKERDIY
ncbi:TPA: hypothetical protein DCX15_03385 [bacterium]|nr:hypothetical protein [bacterium]